MTLPPEITSLLWTAVSSGIVAGGTWLYHKIKGDKQDALGDMLWPIIEGNALKLASTVTADDTVDSVRAKLTAAAQDGLKRLGYADNVIAKAIVQALIEKGVTEVRKAITDRINGRLITSALEQTTDATKKVADAFVVKGDVTKLDQIGEVLVICSWPKCALPKDHEPPHKDSDGNVL